MIEQTFVSKEDEELLKFIESSAPKICVVGTGGGGCNTLNRIFEIGVNGASIVAMNTDAHHLVKTRADKKLLLGRNTTKGLGAGSNPDVGEAAAQESEADIKDIVKDADLVFVTCGMGGGTGTGSAHIIVPKKWIGRKVVIFFKKVDGKIVSRQLDITKGPKELTDEASSLIGSITPQAVSEETESLMHSHEPIYFASDLQQEV